MRLIVTGDFHAGATDQFERFDNLIELYNDFTKDDYVLILGDFSVPWFHYEKNSNDNNMIDMYIIDIINKYPWTTLFIPGNHENYDNIKNFEECKLPFCDDTNNVKRISESIYMLEDGYYEFGEFGVFCFGGALSVDKHHRIEGVSWWKDEIPTVEHTNKMFNLFINKWCERKIQFMFTHTAPNKLIKYIVNNNYMTTPICPVSNALNVFFENMLYHEDIFNENFLHWYCGHFHCNKRFEKEKRTCLFKKTVRII